MEKDLINKLAQMLKGDKEMKTLAVTIFCENTNKYEDYWYLRTLFNDKAILLPAEEQNAFNLMFQNVDRDTIDPFLSIRKAEYREKVKEETIGRSKVIEKSCIITTKTEQRKQLKK